MSSNTELVLKVMRLIEDGNVSEASSCFAGELTFSGPVPEPMDRSRFIDFLHSLLIAFPNLQFNETGVREKGDTVCMEYHLTGTNIGPIDFPALGLREIPATGKSFALPAEKAEAVVEGGRITSLKIAPAPGGGVKGIFDQMGIRLPEPAKA